MRDNTVRETSRAKRINKKINNNTIRNIARKNNQKNRSRSYLIMTAITLSTILLTMILSYGNGLIKFEKESAAERFGSYYGIFNSIDSETINKIEQDGTFTDLGLLAECGYVESKGVVSLSYLDAQARELTNADTRIAEGRYPEKGNEILVSEAMLKLVGQAGKQVGDTIKLSYRPNLDEAFRSEEFVITGMIEQSDSSINVKSACGMVSEEFFQKNCLRDDFTYDVLFRTSEDISFDYENARAVISRLAAKYGIGESQVSVNTLYIMSAMDPGTQTKEFCAALVLAIVLFSMVVIYNIFQMSVVQKMQEYGRLKAIGASKRQMKRLINHEGMLLALPSIPLGVVIGFVAAYLSFGLVVDLAGQTSDYRITIANFFSPAVVLASAALSAITVWLAIAKPKRKLAKISAMQAITYREGSDKKTRSSGLRKGYAEMNAWKIAIANIAAEKKRTVLTILSMGLSCVMFVVMANCLGNIDIEYEARKDVMHGQFQIELDSTFYDKAYPENNLDNIVKDNPLSDEFIRELKAIDGVTKVSSRDRLVIEEASGQLSCLDVLSREDFNWERDKGAAVGNLDYDTASSEGQIIYGYCRFMEDEGIKVGDTINYTLDNGRKKISLQSQVGGSFGSAVPGWAITEDYYKTLDFNGVASRGIVWVDCAEEDVPKVEAAINDLLLSKEHLSMETYHDSYKNQLFGTRIIRTGIYSLLIMIGFIGFMNLANTMINSITTKRREYGIIQALGMTNDQLRSSLALQGLIYIAGIVIVSLLVGLPMGYWAFASFKSIQGFGMNVYHFPILEILLMIITLTLMQLFLSWLLSRNLKRESLVERIRF